MLVFACCMFIFMAIVKSYWLLVSCFTKVNTICIATIPITVHLHLSKGPLVLVNL